MTRRSAAPSITQAYARLKRKNIKLFGDNKHVRIQLKKYLSTINTLSSMIATHNDSSKRSLIGRRVSFVI